MVLVAGLAGAGYLGGRRLLGGSGAIVTAAGEGAPGGSAGLPVTLPSSPAPTAPVTASPSAATAPAPATTSATTTAAEDSAELTAADRTAGLLANTVPQRGTGRLVVVPGSVDAPGAGPVKRVRVEVEEGLDVDPAAFAAFVLDTLNDPRSWGKGGRMTFARTGGRADIRVVLASPDTSVKLCAPLDTMGTLSCGVGNTAVLTLYRWVKAIPDFGADRTAYRHYVVNHEVGHTLGHGHELCPGPGRVAPLMMQQTKGLKGCLPNGWPYP